MSRIFIDRPIFAWVIAIIIMLMGIGAIISLPVAQYPDVAPTQINIRASYPGASAATLESSVTQVLERQLTGIDGLLYFNSSSPSRGSVSISAVFDKGVDPDIAQVQVQNKVQQAISRLPQQVQQQGVTVTKGAPDLLLIVGDLRQDRQEHQLRRLRLADDQHAGRAVARSGRRRRQRVRFILRDAHLARSAQACELPAQSWRRRNGDPEPEYRSRRRRDRRDAIARRPDARTRR